MLSISPSSEPKRIIKNNNLANSELLFKGVPAQNTPVLKKVGFDFVKANYVPFLGRAKDGEYLLLKPDGTGLNDINGNNFAKEKLKLLRDYLINPSSNGNYTPPKKTILLSGPSGNGKTALIKALANDLSKASVNIPVIQASGGRFHINAPRNSSENLDRLFDFVEEQAKKSPAKAAILYLDDIENLCRVESSSSNDEAINSNRLLSVFKDNIENFIVNNNEDVNIFLIGETRNEGLIDSSIFSEFNKLNIEAPSSTSERLEILKSLSNKMGLKFGEYKESNDRCKELYLRVLAEKTNGMSVSDLKKILENAKDLSWSQRSFLLPDDISNSYLNYKFGLAKKSESPDWFFKVSAAHELGHAVVRHAMKKWAEMKNLPYALPQEIDCITLNRRGSSIASVILKDISHKNPTKSLDYLFAEITSNYASIPAEYYLCDGLIDGGPANDIKVNTGHIQDAVTLFGMNQNVGVLQPGNAYDKFQGYMNSDIAKDEKEFADKSLEMAFKIIEFYKPFIEKLANTYTDEYKNDSSKMKPFNIDGQKLYEDLDKFVEQRDGDFQKLIDNITASKNQLRPYFVKKYAG